ncbi:uncharacterized protein LOC111240694 [Vigna radiata var. radiata]|uniref:Uncharacterized protein LOC111240694 n=1 Tax=Vigna radiata var. radiata TaxID=3916 RepID=A0A3Q0ENZ9_VIGRR|nr:uncharacterized protein LOC111240694 [Vigna radiata var. radiata]
MFVDAVAGGSLLDKTPTEARKLLSKMAGNDPDEVSGQQRTQVYSELNLPIEFSEVQENFHAFELLKVEPMKPDLNSTFNMPVHSDILDSAFQIEHINIPIVVSDTCIDLNSILYDSLDDAADDLEIELKEARNFGRLGEVPIPIPNTQQLPVEEELLLQQFNWKSEKQNLAPARAMLLKLSPGQKQIGPARELL